MQKTVAELAQAQHLPLLRLDLTVTAESPQIPQESVKFTVTLSPGLVDTLLPARTINVPVLILDLNNFGNTVNKMYPMSSKGQTITDTVDVPGKGTGFPDPGRDICIIVDPFNTIAERNEANNWAKAYCYSIG